MEETELHALEMEWRARFGEPLPMRTDVDLIRQVLADAGEPAPVAEAA